MDKPWGAKRICPGCGSKFYDLNRNPAECPKCGRKFDPTVFVRSRRGRLIRKTGGTEDMETGAAARSQADAARKRGKSAATEDDSIEEIESLGGGEVEELEELDDDLDAIDDLDQREEEQIEDEADEGALIESMEVDGDERIVDALEDDEEYDDEEEEDAPARKKSSGGKASGKAKPGGSKKKSSR